MLGSVLISEAVLVKCYDMGVELLCINAPIKTYRIVTVLEFVVGRSVLYGEGRNSGVITRINVLISGEHGKNEVYRNSALVNGYGLKFSVINKRACIPANIQF